jgi:hypothetical protein
VRPSSRLTAAMLGRVGLVDCSENAVILEIVVGSYSIKLHSGSIAAYISLETQLTSCY